MTKEQAKAEFIDIVKTSNIRRWKRNDRPALREAWNNFTDYLCKERRITPRQYDQWLNPFLRPAAPKTCACGLPYWHILPHQWD